MTNDSTFEKSLIKESEARAIINLMMSCYKAGLKDAENFDKTLKRYSESSEAEKEFRKAVSQYSCLYAVESAIKQDCFHLNLVGEHSEELIIACENMIGGGLWRFSG